MVGLELQKLSIAAGPLLHSRWRRALPAVRLGVLLAALAGAAATAGAASPAADLTLDFHGIDAAALAASQLSPDAIQCGLDLDPLTEAARQPAANAGMVLRADAAARITVSAMTVRLPAVEQCVTAVLLGVYAQESFFSSDAGWMRSGYFVVWQRSLMVSTPVAQHPGAVAAAVGRLTEQMLTVWRAQNPRPAAAADGQ